MNVRPALSVGLYTLDNQIHTVEDRIDQHRHRIVDCVSRIEHQTRDHLVSPMALMSAALVGAAISQGIRQQPSGRSNLVRTLDAALLLFSRVSLLTKLKTLPMWHNAPR